MKKNSIIRKISIDDLRDISLFVATHSSVSHFFCYQLDEEFLADVLSKSMDFSFIAEGKRTIQGIIIGDLLYDSQRSSILRILLFGVESSADEHIKEQLLDTLLEEAVSAGVKIVELSVSDSSSHLQQLLDKFDFTVKSRYTIMEKRICDKKG